MQSLAAAPRAQVVAVDGKTACRSHDAGRGVPSLHLVGAWVDAARLVLGQRRVDSRSNEITAIPALLETLVLEGCTFEHAMILSAEFGVSAVVGLYASCHLNVASGPAMALVATAIFAVAYAVAAARR